MEVIEVAIMVYARRAEIFHRPEEGTVLRQADFDGLVGKPFPTTPKGGVTAGTLVAAIVRADGSVKLTVNYNLNPDLGISDYEVTGWPPDPFSLGGTSAICLFNRRNGPA